MYSRPVKGIAVVFLAVKLHLRPCQTKPLCESHRVEFSFAQWFEKVLALSMVCGQSCSVYDMELLIY